MGNFEKYIKKVKKSNQNTFFSTYKCMKHNKSIEELTNRYLDLYSYAYSMLKNKADAEDVLHDAISVTLSYPVLLNPYGFCVKVIKRRSVDLLRCKGMLLPLSEELPNEDEEESEYVSKMKEAMSQLDKRELMLVKLHDIEGLSVREISEDTGIGISNIKKILSNAHKKIRSFLT